MPLIKQAPRREEILVRKSKEALVGPDPPPWFHFSIFADQHTLANAITWLPSGHLTHMQSKQTSMVARTHTHTYYWLPFVPKDGHTHKQLFTQQLAPHTQTQLTQLESLSKILALIINSSEDPTLRNTVTQTRR